MRGLLLALIVGAAADENPNCAGWAKQGECSKNPSYMLAHCRASCAPGSPPRSPWADREPSVQHAIWPEVRLQTDGIGGHVVRGVWQIGAAHLLGLRLVCGPNLLFNGHMVRAARARRCLARFYPPPRRGGQRGAREPIAAPVAVRATPR